MLLSEVLIVVGIPVGMFPLSVSKLFTVKSFLFP
jgi:hypothetical protein